MRSASRRPLGVWVRWLVLLVQIMVGLLPLQASGVLHVVADVVTVVAGETLHQGEPPCAYEQQGERCPPDCSHCHCPSLLPVVLATWPPVSPPRVRILVAKVSVYDATAPPRPMLAGLERPPRHLLLA